MNSSVDSKEISSINSNNFIVSANYFKVVAYFDKIFIAFSEFLANI